MPEFNQLNSYTAPSNGAGLNGTGTVIKSSITREGDVITTYIYIDLTGLRSTAGGDIIGIDGTSDPCYVTQIKSGLMGTIFEGNVYCSEAPTGGDPDIDIYSATEGTGAEDAAITSLTETQLVDAGDHAVGGRDAFTALPVADSYLYLVAGATTDADYTAGILVIELKGFVV